MNTKKLSMVGMALLACTLAFGDTCLGTDGLVWTYTISSGKATLSGVTREDGAVLDDALRIPATVNGVSVTAIAVNAFQGLPIKSLTFAEGVKTINYGVCAGCTSLETVTFPNSLTTIYGTGNYDRKGAFENCTALTNVTFGSGIVSIGSDTDSHGGHR